MKQGRVRKMGLQVWIVKQGSLVKGVGWKNWMIMYMGIGWSDEVRG